jgi:uncharacterized protein (TIGR03435 family)
VPRARAEFDVASIRRSPVDSGMGVAIMAAQESATQSRPSAPASPTFEVATVKANKSGELSQFIRRQPGGRVTVTNMPLRQLIGFAYQLAEFQLTGGPPWMASDRFDIVAKMEGDPPAVMPGSGPDALMLAMRALLADRFKLKIHRETREMDIYALVMAKPGGAPGPALKPSATDCVAQAAARRNQPPPQGPPPMTGPIQCGIMGFPGMIRFGGFPISQVTQMLAGQTGRMVVDRTGLTGNWDFELHFAAEQRGQPPPGVNFPAPDPDAPSLFTALQEQLGLKLQSTKAPVDVTVIDSIEHPTDD